MDILKTLSIEIQEDTSSRDRESATEALARSMENVLITASNEENKSGQKEAVNPTDSQSPEKPKKRLSGAQKRKRKMLNAEIASQSASQGAGSKKTSQASTSAGEPVNPSKDVEKSTPSMAATKIKTNKRRRPANETPPSGGQEKKRSRKTPPNQTTKPKETYRDMIEMDLRLVVKSSNSQELNSEHVTSIFKAIDVTICKTPSTSEALGFTKTGVYKGMVDILCTNLHTVDWVKTHVPKMRPWEGANLEVIPFNVLPRTIKCTVFIPTLVFDTPSEILEGIRNQNPGIHTENWSVLGQNRQPKGWLLTLGIDQESVVKIQNVQYRPFLGSQRICFKFSKAELERAKTS